MSQKAWMQAYTKGSKSLQDRLALVHRNNPEFQEFVKKHGFGGNLSVKQSGIQKKSSVGTVQPVTPPSPEKDKNMGREALIKAAAQKIRDRRAAAANRVAFGGELGGGFGLHNVGFRRYSESVERKMAEDIAYKDGHISMFKGGWVAKRDGKRVGPVMPTDEFAKNLLDMTRKSLAQKTSMALKKKAHSVMRGLGIKVAKKPRRAWDSAILPEEQVNGEPK